MYGWRQLAPAVAQKRAGLLLRGASDNPAARVAIARGRFDPTAVSSVALYANYREMTIANGVHPEDPALRLCCGDRALEVDDMSR